jgi:precorrin-6B methylase 1
MMSIKTKKPRNNKALYRCIDVIGMGFSPDDLTANHRRIIDRAEILMGGKRLLAFFPAVPAEKKSSERIWMKSSPTSANG